MITLVCCIMAVSHGVEIKAPDSGYGRTIQQEDAWERIEKNLLYNFCNMYQPCVVERPGESYPYRMWFFGWASMDTNPDESGCDAIYHARSNDLLTWEVFTKDSGWDTEMKPERWKAVLSASTRYYDCWHNGDPSVVWKDGRYYMAYSATSVAHYKKDESHLEGMLLCIMGAISTDGIHWEKTAQPLLIEPPETQDAPDSDRICDFHRPSLMWDGGRWKLWFDYWSPPNGVCMGYAENTGDFAAPGGFKTVHDLTTPIISNWTNPAVVKAKGRYYCFADPPGYPPKVASSIEGRNWSTRALCEAVSDDGLRWRIVGFISPDTDAAANHVPQPFVAGDWLYLFYATQRGGEPVYDYRYDRIRAMRRKLGE